MAPTTETGVLAHVSLSIIGHRDAPRVREAHALLLESLGDGNVEDFESFRDTVSPATDGAVVPFMLCATFDGRIQGFVLGAYLRNLDMGMLLYSAVRQAFRGCGVYTRLRAVLLDLLASGKPPPGESATTGRRGSSTTCSRSWTSIAGWVESTSANGALSYHPVTTRYRPHRA